MRHQIGTLGPEGLDCRRGAGHWGRVCGGFAGEMGFEGWVRLEKSPQVWRGGHLAKFPAERELFVGTESINLVVTEVLWTEIVGD